MIYVIVFLVAIIALAMFVAQFIHQGGSAADDDETEQGVGRR